MEVALRVGLRWCALRWGSELATIAAGHMMIYAVQPVSRSPPSMVLGLLPLAACPRRRRGSFLPRGWSSTFSGRSSRMLAIGERVF